MATHDTPRSRATGTATRPAQRGWTLIELVIGLLVLALLAAVAVPTYLGQVRKLRRADAIAALLRLQQAQERWRTNQPSYAGTLAASGLNLATLSPGGNYLLATRTDPASAASAYQVSAVAQGAQAQDSTCRYMRIDVQGGVIVHQSGPDDLHGNTATLNRRCWNE
ncbi:MAG: hypothetical protein RLY71_709 [Pseudomonadota bacterium]|jgi:type IV pilus assembly protein PilE